MSPASVFCQNKSTQQKGAAFDLILTYSHPRILFYNHHLAKQSFDQINFQDGSSIFHGRRFRTIFLI